MDVIASLATVPTVMSNPLLVTLGTGILFQIFKGGDFEEAIILAVMLFALVASRRHFYRKASLVNEGFGPGWIGRSFPLREIRSWTPVTNPWWYGWGIHLTPSGWLYNVGGSRAVQLDLHNGRSLRVGTDEPERLCEAITVLKAGG